jgi:endoglucanase
MGIATPLSTSGRFIVDANGRRVKLAGVNWIGAHMDDGVVAGLDRVHRDALAQTIAGLGFTCVRFPFSLRMTQQITPVADTYLTANTDLYGSTPMEVYDACVAALTGAGLIVIPNCHMLSAGWCCSNDDGNGLWYNDRWPAEAFMAAWQDMATRYMPQPLVAAMDIKNEPRPARVGWRTLIPTWGDRRKRTDFAAMYTAVGNLIHRINPDLVILCDGLGYAADLTGVAAHPVRLEHPGKVVYGRHDYPWFHPDHQPGQAFADQLNREAGFILADQIAPVWVGEFSTDTRSLASFGLAPPSQANEARNAAWWHNIYAWLTANDVDWCWWGLNATHVRGTNPATGRLAFSWGDRATDGLLADDWSGAASPAIMEILQSMMPARTGPGIR